MCVCVCVTADRVCVRVRVRVCVRAVRYNYTHGIGDCKEERNAAAADSSVPTVYEWFPNGRENKTRKKKKRKKKNAKRKEERKKKPIARRASARTRPGNAVPPNLLRSPQCIIIQYNCRVPHPAISRPAHGQIVGNVSSPIRDVQ